MSVETDHAWAAGFFDGEGCVSWKQGRKVFPRIEVGQKDRRALDRFRQIVGVGKVGGPYEQRGIHRYYVGGQDNVLHVIALMWPYLGYVKKAQFIVSWFRYQDYLDRNPPTYCAALCGSCGKSFIQTRPNQKWCSRTCYHREANARRRAKI